MSVPPPPSAESVLQWCRQERQASVKMVADYVAGEVRIFRQTDGGGLFDVTPDDIGHLQTRIRNLGLLLKLFETSPTVSSPEAP